MTLTLLIFYSLAVYRLAALLSNESGPWAVFSKLRSFLKREAQTNKPLRQSKVHLGIACMKCDSVWLAAPVAAYAYYHDKLSAWFAATGDIFLLCMALSSVAIILNRAFPAR